MKKKNTGKKGFGGLFLRMYISFAAVIALFAVILGVLFMRMFKSATINDYQKELQTKTVNLANRCSKLNKNKQKSQWITNLITLQEVEGLEIWLWSNKEAEEPLWPDLTEDPDDTVLGQGYVDAVKACFSGEVQINTTYNSDKGYTALLCAAPVYGPINEANQISEVIGAVVMSTNVNEQRDVTNTGMRLITISLIIALVVTVIVAVPVVTAISAPISRIQYTAFTLADGDYSARTGIKRNDEVGQLAKTMDFLAGKLAEADAERKNVEQTRRDFFANVSHELRTPITVVKAYAESLNDGVVTKPEKVKQYYARMLNECTNMERLVGDLLTLSKMQNPDFVVEKEPVDLRQIFVELLKMGGTLADEKGVKLKFKKPEGPCVMMADYGRLRQMFIVILDNAIKFSHENGTVYLELQKVGDEIIASIRDEGVGIPEEDLPYIFEKFFKSKLRQNAKGSGLGLAIANQICLKHDGKIKVESEKDKGTCFTFTFHNAVEE